MIRENGGSRTSIRGALMLLCHKVVVQLIRSLAVVAPQPGSLAGHGHPNSAQFRIKSCDTWANKGKR